MTDRFNIYAGQLVADGIDTTAPVIPFDQTSLVDDLRVLDGVMGKVSKMIFKQPKAFVGPLDSIFMKGTLPYGVANEIVAVKDGPSNLKTTGACVPRGQVEFTSQLNIVNYAYNVDVDIADNVLRKYVSDGGQLSGFVSMILASPQKRIASEKYAVQKHLVSNVISGVREIVSNSRSDGAGSAVTYSADAITGYCGKVETVEDTLLTIDVPGARAIIAKIEDAYDHMSIESDDYNVQGVNDFLNVAPNIIIDKALLRAMDRALTEVTSTHPSIEETAYSRLSKIGNVIGINGFDTLPTSDDYTTETIGCVLVSPAMFYEDYLYADVESQRCVSKRLTGYSYRGESVMYADRSESAYALLLGAPEGEPTP